MPHNVTSDSDTGISAIVLVHGAGMSRAVWDGLIEQVARRSATPVFALNLPGHGDSNGEDVLPSIADMAEWLGDAIQTAVGGKVMLAGHSMGGLVALHAAGTHPDQVAKLALLGVNLTMPVHPALLEVAAEQPEKAVDMILKWGLGSGCSVDTRDALQARMEQARPGVLAAGLAACNAYDGGAEAAAAVSCPALVIAGAEDKMTPADKSRVLAEAIGNAKLEIYESCGHMMMVEAPEKLSASLLNFF